MHDPESESANVGSRMLTIGVAQIWRYRFLMVLAIGVGTLVGLFRSLTIPNQYRSVGKLFVRPGIRDILTPDAAFSGSGVGSSRLSSREAVENELQVLSAPQLFDKVVQRITAETLLAPYDPGAAESGSVSWHTRLIHDFQTWWFSKRSNLPATDVAVDLDKLASLMLAESVSVVPELGASVISFSYVAHTPETAQTVVNAVLAAAIEVHREVFETMSQLGAIEKEMQSAEEIARAAEKALRDFRVKNGLYNYESQRDSLLSYLRQLDERADTITLDKGRKVAERDAVRGLSTNRGLERTVRAADSVVVNPAYGALASHLMQLQQMDLSLEFERGALSDGEYQWRKKKLSDSMDATKAQMEKEGMQLKLQGALADNPDYERITRNLDDLEVALKGIDSQKKDIDSQREATKGRLAEFEAMSPVMRPLELDALQKRAKADQLAEGISRMKTVQRLEQLNLSSVQVMHGGTFEPDKVAPQRSQKLLFGAFGGAAVGVLLSLLLAWRDPRVRGLHDLLQLSLPAGALMRSIRGGEGTLRGEEILPSVLAEARSDIDRFWATVSYDRRASEGLKLACLPCEGADAGKVAACLAIGLAVHAGERVAYVSCADGSSWLARLLKLDSSVGWSQVVKGDRVLKDIVLPTTVSGLSYISMGSHQSEPTHPMSSSRFVRVLDELCQSHRFVVVELPPLADMPGGRAVVSVVDAAFVAVRAGKSRKDGVRETHSAVQVAGARLLGVVLQDA